MSKTHISLLLCGFLAIVGCSQEQPVRTVQEFLDNPSFLEAAMVRCSLNRDQTRYDAECVNARQAVSLVEAREERAQRDQLEAESESKRDALRRTQRAAAEARRRSAEQNKLREEAEYLALFGESPQEPGDANEPDLEANVPGAVISSAPQPAPTRSQDSVDDTPEVIFDEPVRDSAVSMPASDGANAPLASNEAEPDLNAVRDELQRRQDAETD
jgi:hypothetical protein